MLWQRTKRRATIIVALSLILASFSLFTMLPFSEDEEVRAAQMGEIVRRRRLRTLESACPQHRPPRKPRNRGYVSHKIFHLAFCHVPKAASTWWLTVLADANVTLASRDADDDGELHRLVLADASPAPSEDYFKVVFVRHPLRRLASAYVSKFVMAKNERFLKPLLRFLQRRPEWAPSKNKKTIINFPTFVDFVLDELLRERLSFGSLHWMPASWMCDICRVK